MPSICLCFRVHLPFALKNYSFWDFSRGNNAFIDDATTAQILSENADNFWLPMNRKLREIVQKHQGLFKMAFYISGTTLEQMATYRKDVIDSFANLSWSGGAEFLGGTYSHSLSYLYSKTEFLRQSKQHSEQIYQYFDQSPLVYVQAEELYGDEMATLLRDKMFAKGVLCDVPDDKLRGRRRSFIYSPQQTKRPSVLIQHKKYSEQFVEMFAKGGEGVDTFLQNIRTELSRDEVAVIYVDYADLMQNEQSPQVWEAFAKGVFSFPDIHLLTPSMLLARYNPIDSLYKGDNHTEGKPDWLKNPFQHALLNKLYEMEGAVSLSQNKQAKEIWYKLQTLDYYKFIKEKNGMSFTPDELRPAYFDTGKLLPHTDYNTLASMIARLQAWLEETVSSEHFDKLSGNQLAVNS